MLMIAEGTLDRVLPEDERSAARAWLRPMINSGFLQAAYLDSPNKRVLLVIAAPDLTDARERLADLPVVQNGRIEFTLHPVTALAVAD